MSDKYKKGSDMKLYRGKSAATSAADAGFTGVGFTEVKNIVGEVKINRSRQTTSEEVRGEDTLIYFEGKADGSISFEVLYEAGGDDYDALNAAADNGTVLAFASTDGDITKTGTRGVRGNYIISDFTESQPSSGGVKVSVELKPRGYNKAFKVTS